MKRKTRTIDEEAAILKNIDEQLKGLSPDIRAEAFQILVARHLGKGPSTSAEVSGDKESTGRKRRGVSSTTDLRVVPDLNFKKGSGIPSLRDFFAEKSPRAFSEQNTVFVYYLDRLRKVENITPNHIYSCYKEVRIRVPGAFYQSLLDTARNKGWIDTKDTTAIKLTTVGENFVEHDLPKVSEG